jgi:hypothetical protein
VQPQGLNVAPNGISVVPTGTSIAPVGKSTAPVDIAYAPVDIDLDPDHKDKDDDHDHEHGDHDHDHGSGGSGDASPDSDIPPPPGRRLLSTQSPFTPGKLHIMPDPLDLSNEFPADYRNWAAVLSQVLLKKEGNADAASSALARVMLDAHGSLAKAADGEPFLPRFHLTDPVFLGKGPGSGLPPMEATKFDSSASFVNFAPCVLSEGYTGLSAEAVGLSIDPALVSISAALSSNEIVGLNLNPNLIFLSVSKRGVDDAA